MKKLELAMAVVLTAMLLLAACGGREARMRELPDSSLVPAAPAPELPADPAPEEEPLPTAGQLGRQETGSIPMLVEGELEEVPAALYIGEAYSLYIPREGWLLTDTGLWQAENNEDVLFWIGDCPAATEEACRTAVVNAMPEFQFSNLANGTFYGSRRAEAMTVQVWLFGGEGGYRTVFAQYPDEAAEGYGARMSAMVKTFQLS